MAALLSSHLSAVARNPTPLRPHSLRRTPSCAVSFPSVTRRSPRFASFPSPSATYGDEGPGASRDEWRKRRPKHPEKHRKHPEKPSEDEGEDPAPGAAAGPGEVTGIPDEWGERVEPEVEPPAEPDPSIEEDEWGRDPGNGGGQAAQAEDDKLGGGVQAAQAEEDKLGGGGQAAEAEEDKLGDLKRCLVDTFYGTELGLRTSAEVRAEVLELVGQLEAENPTPAPTEATELLDGNWILLYTAFSELLPLIAIGTTPLLKVKMISQAIDTKSSTIINSTTLSSPFASFSFSASASFEVRSPSRVKVRFTEGTFDPPVISSTVDLPENVDIFGRKIDLLPLQQTLNPVQEAAANMARVISGQPPLKVPIPGDRAASWLLTTYLDKDLRISRGDGGLFVLAKEGSPLLDQLS